MNSTASKPAGWLESLRRIGESSFALARGRLELFTVEWREEKLRLLHLLFWLVVAMTIGAAGLFIALAALALWLWDQAGYPGLIGLALVVIATSVGMLLGIRRKIQADPQPFAQTLAEFRKDGECLHRTN